MDIVTNTAHLPDTEGGDNELTPEGNVADSRAGGPRPSERPFGIPRRRFAGTSPGSPEPTSANASTTATSSRPDHRPRGVRRARDRHQTNLQRLFQALAEYGVLAMWEREAAGLRGAA
jgi:hypothetical protein